MIRPEFQSAYDQFQDVFAKIEKTSKKKRKENLVLTQIGLVLAMECLAQDCIGKDEQKLLAQMKKQSEELFLD